MHFGEACLLRPCHCSVVADAVSLPYTCIIMYSPHASCHYTAYANAMPYILYASCVMQDYSQ